MFQTIITSISSIYPYHTSRKTWENIGPRKHYILSYQLSGCYVHEFSFGALSVKTDTLFLIDRNDSYSVKSLDSGDSICVSFSGETNLSTMTHDCSGDPRIRNLFRKLLQYRNLLSESNCCAAMAVLYEIISFIYKSKEREYVAPDTTGRIREVHRYILEHYCDPNLKIASLSGRCHISPKYFRELFRKIYGTTPTQYLIDLRLNAAAELLAEGIAGVSEAAEIVGFSDVYYFSKLFKKRFSCTPSDFRAAAHLPYLR